MARVGYLYLSQGIWDNTQIISEKWIKESTAMNPHNTDIYGGYTTKMECMHTQHKAMGQYHMLYTRKRPSHSHRIRIHHQRPR